MIIYNKKHVSKIQYYNLIIANQVYTNSFHYIALHSNPSPYRIRDEHVSYKFIKIIYT